MFVEEDNSITLFQTILLVLGGGAGIAAGIAVPSFYAKQSDASEVRPNTQPCFACEGTGETVCRFAKERARPRWFWEAGKRSSRAASTARVRATSCAPPATGRAFSRATWTEGCLLTTTDFPTVSRRCATNCPYVPEVMLAASPLSM